MTGKIAHHCIVPDEEHYDPELIVYHDDADEEDKLGLRLRLTQKEIFRMGMSAESANSS